MGDFALRQFGGFGGVGTRDWAARVSLTLRGERGCASEPVAREGACRSRRVKAPHSDCVHERLLARHARFAAPFLCLVLGVELVHKTKLAL